MQTNARHRVSEPQPLEGLETQLAEEWTTYVADSLHEGTQVSLADFGLYLILTQD